MKRIMLLLIVIIYAITSRAQIQGGFNCRDPKAFFDKEIYFVAYNGWTVTDYYGRTYGQDVYNPVFVVNGKDTYTMTNGVWSYGSSVTIEGTKLDKGSTVSLYINNRLIQTWTCRESQPSIAETSLRIYSDSLVSR